MDDEFFDGARDAIKRDDDGLLARLITAHTDPEETLRQTDSYGCSLACTAAQHGATACLARLLAMGVDINQRDALGDTPLHAASRENSPDSVRWLLAHCADAGLSGEDLKTPLQTACYNDSPDAAKELIEQGVDINFRGESGRTPVDYALTENATATALLLVEKGADLLGTSPLQARPEDGLPAANPLQRAVMRGAAEVLQAMLARCDKPESVVDHNGESLLHLAVQSATSLPCVGPLLAAGIDINTRNHAQRTALHTACHYGHGHAMTALLARGADCSIPDSSGAQPIHACFTTVGAIDRLQLLLEHGADCNATTVTGETPLSIAVKNATQCPAAVSLLLAAGAVPGPAVLRALYHLYGSRHARGYTKQRRHVLALLLAHGIDLATDQTSGNTLLHAMCVTRAPAKDIAMLLEHQDPDVNAINDKGRTPLMALLSSNWDVAIRPNTVNMLLDHGASPDMTDNNGDSALDLARKNVVSQAIFEILSRHSIDAATASATPAPVIESEPSC